MSFFEQNNIQQYDTDVLIVGAGLAGLRAAIEATSNGYSVLMITKGFAGRAGSSAITSGGYAVGIGHADPEDNPDVHYQDTLRGGKYINNKKLAKICCDEAIDRFWELIKWGAEYEKVPETDKYVQLKSGDHSRPRVAINATHKGIDLTLPLKNIARDVNYVDHVTALDLIVEDNCANGVIGLDTKNLNLVCIRAMNTILASGGIGQLFSVTSNPNDVTGDGLSLAFKAGAILSDLEFIQFYPWRLISQVQSRMPVQPSTFAHGAMLRNIKGERFMLVLDPKSGESTTRDIAARGIYTEIVEGRGIEGGVRLDLSNISLETFKSLNPRIFRYFKEHGYDLAASRLILAPEAHYHMGGIRIDEFGHTSLQHLYAVGEVSSGVDGANRLDSNAIPSGQVFGKRAGKCATDEVRDHIQLESGKDVLMRWNTRLETLMNDSLPVLDTRIIKNEVRDLMWRNAGIVRSGDLLEQGKSIVIDLKDKISNSRPSTSQNIPEFLELEKMTLAAELIFRAAILRTESRGAHYRVDFPNSNDEDWMVNIDVFMDTSGNTSLIKRSID